MQLSNTARTVLTAVASMLLFGAIALYNAAMPGIEAQVALMQVRDSIADYAFAKAFLSSNIGKPFMFIVYTIVLGVLWWRPLVSLLKSFKNQPENKQP